MIICTVTAANHLAFAKVLAKSAKAHVKGCKFVLCLMENEIHPEATGFDDVVLIKELGIPDFKRHIASKNIYELSGIIKPYLLQHAFDRYANETKFVYMDADSRIYGSFSKLDELLNRHNILFTPHRAKPQNHPDAAAEELVNLKNGVFQVGFIALSKTAESRRFLAWWSARCRDHAVVDYNRGLFGDQKWLNLAPCFFKGVYILRDPAYHVASWNLSQRKLKRDSKGGLTVGGNPLVFFHFSGMGRWLDKSIELHASKNGNVQNLVNQYKQDLKDSGYDQLIAIPWGYEKILRHEANQPAAQLTFHPMVVHEPIINGFIQEPNEEEDADEGEPIIEQGSESLTLVPAESAATSLLGKPSWKKRFLAPLWEKIKEFKTTLIQKLFPK
ncbi:hypothetical protein ACFPVX_07755 [Cohnella faecalis]|uniref:Glycosyl transferase n=1 Tax=Cohnella faecalis TaxID=2315694 RepID=A0A398CY00_9BACL|nr:hypothetical protein [Cohnella faecalis]RIE04101.1 hypothetical protein D3H35_09160 [Cohnella faecalis]